MVIEFVESSECKQGLSAATPPRGHRGYGLCCILHSFELCVESQLHLRPKGRSLWESSMEHLLSRHVGLGHLEILPNTGRGVRLWGHQKMVADALCSGFRVNCVLGESLGHHPELHEN